MTLSEFLSLVLPQEGYYCVQGFKGDSNKIYFCDAQADAEDKIDSLIQQEYDTYFGVAKYKTNENRKFYNVECLQVFMLDVDCGPTKSFADKSAGLASLADFCNDNDLYPPTLIIDSGNGVHAYWVMDAPVPRDVWKVAAEALKLLCKESGFDADPSVTADAARIMRVLGSFNHKTNPPLPTALLLKGDVISFEQFRASVKAVGELPPAPSHIPREPSELMKRHQERTRKLFHVLTDKIKAGLGCPQMERIITQQLDIMHDAWRSGLSIARNCEDWETAIHDISSEHPRYDYAATVKKADDTIDKPHRCTTFDAHSPKICDKCQYKGKISSPIELCVEFIEAKDNLVVNIEDGAAVTYTLPTLPPGYKRLATGGIYYHNKDGEDELIYEHDIYLIKRMHDEDRGDLALAKLHLPREKPREFVIPLSSLMAKDRFKDILSTNGVIGSQRQMDAVMMYLVRFAKEQQLSLDLEILRPQFGWADENTTFVLGTTEYSQDGSKHTPAAESTKDVARAIRQRGDLSEWSKVANVYGNDGFEAEAFALFAGFGAMLMKFTNYKGAMINLLHPDSGTGKTTILKVINSIVGHPDELLSKESDTLAYKLHLLGVHNNIATTYDELTNTLPEVVSNLLYAVTQGKGANRMQAQVNAARRNDTTWSTLAISSSNASLVQKLGVLKAAANGEIMRLMEYRIDRKTLLSKQEAYEIFEGKMYQNYGVAGPVYVDWLVKNLSTATSMMNKFQLSLDSDAGLETRERFWSSTSSCAFAAGDIINKIGLVNIPVKPVYDWAVRKLIPELRMDLKSSADTYNDTLGQFMGKHVNNVLVVDDAVDARTGGNIFPQVSPRGELLIRIEPDTKLIFVSSKAFKKYCTEQQILCKDLLGVLAASGVYMGEVRKRMSKGTLISAPSIYAFQFSFSNQDIFNAELLLDDASRNKI
jgi:hypothetical protein